MHSTCNIEKLGVGGGGELQLKAYALMTHTNWYQFVSSLSHVLSLTNQFFFFQLALKTVNGARSAFATFHFKRNFFHSYRHVRRGGSEEEEPLKCKISAKVSHASH